MLTEISTFGWFGDQSDLLAISTFGWFVADIGIEEIEGIGLFQDFDGLFDGGLWY